MRLRFPSEMSVAVIHSREQQLQRGLDLLPPRNSSAAIRRIAALTPFGVTPQEMWQALLAGRCISNLGRVPLQRDGSDSRALQLGLRAARAAMPPHEIAEAALIVGTSKGSI